MQNEIITLQRASASRILRALIIFGVCLVIVFFPHHNSTFIAKVTHVGFNSFICFDGIDSRIPNEKKKTRTQKEEEEVSDLKTHYAKYDPKSIKHFRDMPLSAYTLKGLKENNYDEPTQIQKESIGLCFRGSDVLGAAKTGCGKTLAFVIPILELLHREKWTKLDGLGALVITPTRELAYQIFETLRKVGKHHEFSAGLVIGGKDLQYETKRLSTCNIVICTPGRLLQHMDENPQFDPITLQILVLDEADRCLDLGFAETMNAILGNLPKERQTLLFSATQTRSIKDLGRLSLKNPVYVSIHEHSKFSTPEKLTQNYMVCELDKKMDMLLSFIKSHRKSKTLVFVQSCKQARYFQELLKKIRVGVSVLGLYGTLHQLRRMSIYEEFCQEENSMVLFATDIAARGLDFPKVDWVFQLDCPEDGKTYLHRVGRTARHASIGKSLMLLTPSEEEGMLKQLSIHRVPIERIEVNPKKLTTCQMKIEANLAGDNNLKEMAQRAFQSYIKSIYLMKNKAIFDVFQIETDTYARSLGLVVTPKEDVLTIKRKDHDLERDDLPSGEEDNESVIPEIQRKQKVITKASLAKKVIKKNLSLNNVVQFNEEGDVVQNSATSKMSAIGQEYEKTCEGSGIDLILAREVLKAEDKFDKKLERVKIKEKHKEEKQRLKDLKNKRKKQMKETEEGDEFDEEDSNHSLDWLPDPDKIYGQEDNALDDEDESIESEYEARDNEIGTKRKWKPPKKIKEKSSKKLKSADKLYKSSLAEDEDFALQLLQRKSNHQFMTQDSIINSDESECTPVEIPFELPPEVPSQLQVKYNKVESNDCAEEGQSKTTVHVEVNRIGDRQGARRYSNVETWMEGYSDIPSAFGDVVNELKIHDDKVVEHLQKPCPSDNVVQKDVSSSEGNSICDIDWEHDRKRRVRRRMKDERKKYNSFSQQETNYQISNFPTESTPYPTFYPDPKDEFPPVPIESKSPKHISKLKPKKKKYKYKDITCYSLDMERSRGFILKYAPEKGSCILTADQKNPLKILDPRECAAILIKIAPGKPRSSAVFRALWVKNSTQAFQGSPKTPTKPFSFGRTMLMLRKFNNEGNLKQLFSFEFQIFLLR
ncbi:DDX10 [Lepeophtheirus salmonis]|uniref:ATP-dependent RNA helicase n=1 Tax=Lepeophtheirus salmonis TaxID=72036 RepID=A0A7R8H4K7_LEPSM|nr:DDX10 [Lepeophtheirus salmonis]CAF2864717.1 DDX10 [Lepeophtheirus salmonis]